MIIRLPAPRLAKSLGRHHAPGRGNRWQSFPIRRSAKCREIHPLRIEKESLSAFVHLDKLGPTTPESCLSLPTRAFRFAPKPRNRRMLDNHPFRSMNFWPFVLALFLATHLFLAKSIFAQDAVSPPIMKGGCGAVEFDSYRKLRPAPRVKGHSYKAPKLHLQIFDKKTGKPFSGKNVYVSYYWGFWESDGMRPASDSVACISNDEGVLIVPAYEVTPVGWDKPWWLMFAGKPRFYHIQINVGMDCGSKIRVLSFEFKPSYIKKKSQNGTAYLVLDTDDIESCKDNI